MLDQFNHNYVWHLGSTPTAWSPSDPWTLNIGEPISDGEYASHAASAAFLDEVLAKSAFAGFQESYTEFKQAIAAAAEKFAAKRSTTPSFSVIRRRFDDVLSALRRFDDRTSHALSSRYGTGSTELRTFKQSLSFEFDNQFAYRFCWHLRNYSEHRGIPISRIKQASQLNPDGTVDQAFQAVFDTRVLLRNHDWHTRVRKDLERINGEFSVEATVDELYQSCGRAHCKNLLSQEGEITAAVENIRSFAARATTDNSLAPMFMLANPQNLTTRTPATFKVSVIRTEMIDVAQTALREAHQFD
jgi:hypothetical protein